MLLKIDSTYRASTIFLVPISKHTWGYKDTETGKNFLVLLRQDNISENLYKLIKLNAPIASIANLYA